MCDARSAIDYLNDMTLRSIEQVEQLLLNLPKAGSRCEIEFVRPNQSVSSVKNRESSSRKKQAPKPLSISPTRSSADTKNGEKPADRRQIECRSLASLHGELRKGDSEIDVETSLRKRTDYKILTDNIKVSPIVSMNGVVLDIDVEINISEDNKKLVKLQIECPNYTPARIKVGDKWKNIL